MGVEITDYYRGMTEEANTMGTKIITTYGNEWNLKVAAILQLKA